MSLAPQSHRDLIYAADAGDLPGLLTQLARPGLPAAALESATLSAAGQGRESCLLALLAAHPSALHTRTNAGWSLLHLAVRHGHASLLNPLLDRGLRPTGDTEGWTPLHLALENGHAAIAERLLPLDPGAHTPTASAIHALHLACKQGCLSIARTLLDAGAPVNAETLDGRTPLHYAAEAGYADIVALLLSRGASASARSGIWQLPIDGAAAAGARECVRLLLPHSPKDAEDRSVHDAAHHAITHGHADILQLLLGHGFDAFAVDGKGRTRLACAAESGALACLDLLLDAGVCPNRTAKGGLTPLHLSARNGRTGCLRRLLALAPSPEPLADNLDTPLHLAARGGHLDCIKSLLAAGASPFRPGAAGETSFDILVRAAGTTPLDCEWLHDHGRAPWHAIALRHLLRHLPPELLLAWAEPHPHRLALLCRWMPMDDATARSFFLHDKFQRAPKNKTAGGHDGLNWQSLRLNPDAPGVAERLLVTTPLPALLAWAGDDLDRLGLIAAHAPLDRVHGELLLHHPAFPEKGLTDHHYHLQIQSDPARIPFSVPTLASNTAADPCIRNFITESSPGFLLAWAGDHPQRLHALARHARLPHADWLILLHKPEFDFDALCANPHGYDVATRFLAETPIDTLLLWADGNLRRLGILAQEAPLSLESGHKLIHHPRFESGDDALFNAKTLEHNPHAVPEIRKFLTRLPASTLFEWATPANPPVRRARLHTLCAHAKLDTAIWHLLIERTSSGSQREKRAGYPSFARLLPLAMNNPHLPPEIATLLELGAV